jgi:hypothetical protein
MRVTDIAPARITELIRDFLADPALAVLAEDESHGSLLDELVELVGRFLRLRLFPVHDVHAETRQCLDMHLDELLDDGEDLHHLLTLFHEC